MKINSKIITLILFFFVCLSATATLKLPQKFDEIIELPVQKFSAIESEGQIFYVSNNGRYVITGQLYDMWEGRNLDTISQIKISTETIPLKGLNVKVKDLNTVTLGNGKKDILMFVDPLSDITKELINQSREIINNGNDDFSFKFIFIPALGDKSNVAAKKILCSLGIISDEEILNHVVFNTISQLTNNKCDVKPYDKTLVISTLLQIKRVPFLIADDGRFTTGIPSNYINWLNDKRY